MNLHLIWSLKPILLTNDSNDTDLDMSHYFCYKFHLWSIVSFCAQKPEAFKIISNPNFEENSNNIRYRIDKQKTSSTLINVHNRFTGYNLVKTDKLYRNGVHDL
jgi:hypothetical protein